MISEDQTLELEAAEAVIESWEGICQAQVQAAREAGESEAQVGVRQQRLYAAARERKALARMPIEDIRETKDRYGSMIRKYREASHG